MRAHGVTWDKQVLGDVSMTAKTQGADLAVQASARVRDITIDGEGSWRLAGDDPGTATVRFSRTSVASLHSVVMAGSPQENVAPPFEGFIDGASATVSVALLKPRDFHAELTVGTVQLNAKPAQTFRLGVQSQDVVVKNSKPLVVDISSKEARIRSARFIARDTTLEASGAVAFDPKAGSDLKVRGAVNLIILQLLNPDLAARGNATVQASIRGSLRDPQVNGRMELNNASLYLGDLAERRGQCQWRGDFRPESRDDRKADRRNRRRDHQFRGIHRVRVHAGLSASSCRTESPRAVSGRCKLDVRRDAGVERNAGFEHGFRRDYADAGVVHSARRPGADSRSRPPGRLPRRMRSSDYIRGMQFDVRIQSGPNFELQTSLTRNLKRKSI